MNKKLLELLNAINEKKLEVQNKVEAGKLEEAKTEKAELKKLQDKFDLLKDLDDKGLEEMQNRAAAGAVDAITSGGTDPEEVSKK